MPDRNLRIAVIGAGAIGWVTGSRMTAAGWNVTIVCKHESAVRRGGREEFHIFGKGGKETVRGQALRDIAELPEPPDIVFLATKANDAMGLMVPPGGGGKHDDNRFLSGTGILSDWRRHLSIRIIGYKYRPIRSSSLQSLERGDPPRSTF
jgi:Trk K+ transport system NAD-binding subunit